MDRTPELKFIGEPGKELAVWDWPGEDPPFLFSHATGFHGRCWDRIIRMFPERHCLAVDTRGHGRSSKLDLPCRWRVFGRDLAAVAEHWDVRDAIGIGHSMGGNITVQAAALRPRTFRALLLADPSIFPPESYGKEGPDASFTLRRRNTWASPDEMFERFKARFPFVRWRPEALRDYCEFAVVPRNGKFVLACPPAVEASIYQTCREPASNIYPEVARLRHPVVVMRAGTKRRPGISDVAASPAAADLASRFAHGREILLPEASHHFVMEDPDIVAAEIRKLDDAISVRTARHAEFARL